MRVAAIAFVLFACALPSQAQLAAPDEQTFARQPDAQALFARFKALAGTWEERSTKGWEGRNTIRVIARGSAVLMTGEFNDEPGEGMATLFFVDRDRLLVTHYCEAGNQPTLVARGVSADGNSILFTLDAATGLDTPAEGYMGKAIFNLRAADEYTSRWTFTGRTGQERWMEEIEHRRIGSGVAGR